MNEHPKFEDLKGQVLAIIDQNNEELVFTTNDGEAYKLYHEQQCCEKVTIVDICGDLDDLIGEPLLMAEEIKHANDVNPADVSALIHQVSFTWTFYKLSTIKGAVTIRWCGESNGCYSESVAFCRVA